MALKIVWDWTLIVIFIPAILGYTASSLCWENMGSESGAVVSFRPPAYIFGIVWPILYLFIGLSWYFSLQYDALNPYVTHALFLSLSIALMMWIVVYSCNDDKKGGVFVILVALLLAYLSYTWVNYKWSKMMLVPLFVWLTMALLMNAEEVSILSR